MTYTNLRQHMNTRPLCYALVGGITLLTGCKTWRLEDPNMTDAQRFEIWEKQRLDSWENREYWRNR